MYSIQIILGSKSDLGITTKGIDILKEFGVSFSLRIASAHRSSAYLDKIVTNFEEQGGKVFICVAGMSAHLAGVIASKTIKPVIAVPVAREVTSGLDSLLSISQMPQGIPVATMGFDSSGFANATLMAIQILGLSNPEVTTKFGKYRQKLEEMVIKADEQHRTDFAGE